MSFAAEVKSQMMAIEEKSRACKHAEFYALYIMCGGTLKTANGALAKRAARLCQRGGGVRERVAYSGGKKNCYTVQMRWSGCFSMETPEEAVSFLRGCFLTGGYVTEPDKPAHLEIQFRDELGYELCMAAFELAQIGVKGTIRGRKFILYIKDSEEITAFLARTGAVRGVLEYENVRIVKQCNKESNRVTNCDDANLNKTIATGVRQKKLLEHLLQDPSFGELPQNLRDTVRLRVENPELSLTELGELLNPPVSKAGVAHRMKKLEQLASKKSVS